EVVDQNAAQIEIAAPADERESNAAVDGESGQGSPDHPALDDGDGGAEPSDGFITEPKRKQNQDRRVGVGSKSASAVIAVGFFAVSGPLGVTHGEIGNADGGNIGKIVDRIVQE